MFRGCWPRCDDWHVCERKIGQMPRCVLKNGKLNFLVRYMSHIMKKIPCLQRQYSLPFYLLFDQVMPESACSAAEAGMCL